MKYAAVLFDMDGTLIETNRLWDICTREAVKQHNILLTEEELVSIRSILIHNLLGTKGYSNDDILKVKSVRDAAMVKHLDKISWVPGAQALLASITVPKAIVTSAPRHMFTAFDSQLGMSPYFGHVVTGDDVRPDYKPHPKGLLMACRALNVNPKECVYIGDQITDLQVAEAAGMASILTHGTYTPADLHQSNEVFALEEIHPYLI